MPDIYHGAIPPNLPYVGGAPVVPDDGLDLPTTARALWIGGGGNLTVILRNSTTPITLLNVAGSTNLPLPLYTKRVLASGTTATSIIALW
jgi:hypothetical protein